jgi:hypothetical protein
MPCWIRSWFILGVLGQGHVDGGWLCQHALVKVVRNARNRLHDVILHAWRMYISKSALTNNTARDY